MAAEAINQKTRIELKKLAGVESLSAAQIREILQRSAGWISNFYAEAAGDKKVKGDFAIEGFSYGGEFDLSTAADILNGIAPPRGKVPFLFLSDLVNFVEQIRTSLSSNNISISSTQRQELDRLESTFKLVGVEPAGDKVSIEDLQRIEYIDYSRRIVERIKLIYLILAPSIAPEEKIEEEIAETTPSVTSTSTGGLGLAGLFPGQKKPQETERGGGEAESSQSREPKKTQEPNTDTTPIKISELDPQSRLYLQSLSIITINQALNRYFNEASLAKIGLPPGTQVTFDQLPLDVRRQLMDRAFLQVENLLLSGQFSLDSLIREQSKRINFSNQAALGLLMDVHGLKLLNDSVREIAKDGQKAAAKIKANEKEKLTNDKLSPRIKNDKENSTNTAQAQAILQQKQDEGQSNQDFARKIESELNIVQDEGRLEQIFGEKIRQIIGNQDNFKIKLITDNVRPLIEVFIQQGLPPEYLIPDPKNFDYNRFVNIFGTSIERSEFNNHREELANLIIFYWKRKRIIWASEIRQEFAQEKYTPEEAQQLLKEISKNPQKIAQLRNLGTLNLTYGGREIAEKLAGSANAKVDGAEVNQFIGQQQDLIKKNLEEQLAKMSEAEQQKTLKVYFDFYLPGYTIQEYSIQIFQTQVLPQINPMDFYMLQANETLGTSIFERATNFARNNAFYQNGDGWAQQAFASNSNYQSTDFMDSALGQQSKKLATKALSEGLYLALDAAGGWGEALRAAEAAVPLVKQLKEKLIEMGLEKVLEFIKKNWPWLLGLGILAALGSMLPLLLILAPAAIFLRNAWGGIKDFFTGGGKAINQISEGIGGFGKQGLTAQATQNQVATTQAAQGLKTLTSGISSGAMITAGQAVIATVGASTIFMYVYQTSLNSAFLTDFPFNDPNAAGINSVEKTSKYAEISKTAVIKSGCPSPESNGTKCENPSFPVSIEYTVTIKPKEDFSLQITNIEDTIKFKQSKKAWEDAGQSPPNIPTEKVLDFEYFKGIIGQQGGLSNTSLSPTTTPTLGVGNPNPTTPIPSGSSENIIIEAGSSLTFTYTLDNLSSDYNHTAILNTIEVNFYYQNSYMSGTDNVITAARVCLGECSAGAGCWPTTGNISQLPFGQGIPDDDASHRPPESGGYADAYDITDSDGPDDVVRMVYTTFPGSLCFIKCSDTGYGCYFILTFDDNGTSRKLLFAHFESANSQLSQPNSCMNVDEGFAIGLMGNRGNSTGKHLHYEVDFNGAFYSPSSRNFSILETLVPEADNGNYPPKNGDNVTTCYE